MLARLRLLRDAFFRRETFEREMAAEMQFHISAYADDLVRSGLPRAEAERRARLEFGAAESYREDCRQARGLQLVDELRQDLRYAVRQLRKAPGFTAAAVVSLALGIGASTAVFTLMDAVLFRTLPLADPDALYYLGHASGADTTSSANYPLLERYQAAGIFSGVAAYTEQTFTVSATDGLERVAGQFVSGNYHAVLGVPIAAGRGFSTEPDRPDGRAPVAVISDRYWERKFGRAPDVIGRTIEVAGRAVTIVGVTAPGFRGFATGLDVDITLPMAVKALDDPEYLVMRDGWTSLSLVGRLAPGATEAGTLARVNAVFQPFWMEPENAWAREHDPVVRSGVLLPAGQGSSFLRRRYQTPLRVLMGMVGVVLLIACGNVANLLLARAQARSREVAVRMSIGAGRGRLVRQFLTESLLLACVGGLLGLALAAASTGLLASFLDIGQSPIVLDVALNGRVLAFTTAVCVATGVAFGLAPAFRATRVDLTPALKATGASAGAASGRGPRWVAGKALVVAQISLSLLVIAAAGLLVRSLGNLRTLDAGFTRESVLLFNVETGRTFDSPGRFAFYSSLHERLRGLPGVVSVAYSQRSPIDFSLERRRIDIAGRTGPLDRKAVSTNVVTPGYFATFGIPVTRGRGISEQDREGSSNVALVSESMARTFFGQSDALGRTILLGGNRTPMTIVGIVADVRFEGLRDEPPPMVYTPLAQPGEAFDGSMGYPSGLTVVVRSSGDPRSLSASARELVRALTPDATVSYVRTMDQQLDAALVRERLLASLSTGFGLIALALAFVGLYGVMSYRVAQRSREIGIRIALGATSGRVLRQVLRESIVISVAGIGLGLAAALYATKVLSALLFGLSPRDPLTLAGVAALLLAVALIAGYFPARRAARVEPMRALAVG